MSSHTQSSGIFHLPHLFSKRGMNIFNERVRPKVQPHNDNKTWFQNQYEHYLNLARTYLSYNIPDEQWRFEIVRDGTFDNLQIPPNLLAEQQHANSFALIADPHVTQHGHQTTKGPFYGNATFQNAQFNSNASQLGGHFAPTTSGYSNLLYTQIDSNGGLSDSSNGLNPHAEVFEPTRTSTNVRPAAGPSHAAGAAGRAHSLKNPVTQTVTSNSPCFSSSSQRRQSTHPTPLVRRSRATNKIGAPAGPSSVARGKQRATDNDIATAPPSFRLSAFAAEQRRYNLTPHQVEARQACRSIAPALPFTYSPENAQPPDGEHSTLPYGRGRLSPARNPDDTRKLYIPPFKWTQLQDRRLNDLHNPSKDAIDSKHASKRPSRAQSPHIFIPTPKSSRLTNAIPRFEKFARGQSEEHMDSTTATRPPTPAPPVVSNQVRAAPANALKGLRDTDVESTRALAREVVEEDWFDDPIIDERVLARQVHNCEQTLTVWGTKTREEMRNFWWQYRNFDDAWLRKFLWARARSFRVPVLARYWHEYLDALQAYHDNPESSDEHWIDPMYPRPASYIASNSSESNRKLLYRIDDLERVLSKWEQCYQNQGFRRYPKYDENFYNDFLTHESLVNYEDTESIIKWRNYLATLAYLHTLCPETNKLNEVPTIDWDYPRPWNYVHHPFATAA